MVVTVLKKSFQKAKPRKLIYGSYKDFNETKFKKELRCLVLSNEGSWTEVADLGLLRYRKLCRRNISTIIHKIFETNSSFHVKSFEIFLTFPNFL